MFLNNSSQSQLRNDTSGPAIRTVDEKISSAKPVRTRNKTIGNPMKLSSDPFSSPLREVIYQTNIQVKKHKFGTGDSIQES